MQPLIWESRPDGLRAPAMLVAFSGWNDAGDAASAALTFIGESLGAERFARLDPEEFYDLQSTRPHIGFTDERKREITWPGVEIFAARVPRAQRDDQVVVRHPLPVRQPPQRIIPQYGLAAPGQSTTIRASGCPLEITLAEREAHGIEPDGAGKFREAKRELDLLCQLSVDRMLKADKGFSEGRGRPMAEVRDELRRRLGA